MYRLEKIKTDFEKGRRIDSTDIEWLLNVASAASDANKYFTDICYCGDDCIPSENKHSDECNLASWLSDLFSE